MLSHKEVLWSSWPVVLTKVRAFREEETSLRKCPHRIGLRYISLIGMVVGGPDDCGQCHPGLLVLNAVRSRLSAPKGR